MLEQPEIMTNMTQSMTSIKMQRQNTTRETRLVKVRDTSFQWSKVSLVQDCSRTGNNNELRKGQRSRRKQLKQTKCDHIVTKFCARNLYRPREEVLSCAREFTVRARKFDRLRETRHQRFNFAWRSFTERAKLWQNHADRNDFARDQKIFRAKVQTSL